MMINKIARIVFDSFSDSDIVVAIVNRNGSYTASRLDVFEKVFAGQKLLEELCRRIDDGQEPLVAKVGDYVVAASGIACDFDNNGYAILIVPAEQFECSNVWFDFAEVILKQLSLLVDLAEQNRQLKDSHSVADANAELTLVDVG